MVVTDGEKKAAAANNCIVSAPIWGFIWCNLLITHACACCMLLLVPHTGTVDLVMNSWGHLVWTDDNYASGYNIHVAAVRCFS